MNSQRAFFTTRSFPRLPSTSPPMLTLWASSCVEMRTVQKGMEKQSHHSMGMRSGFSPRTRGYLPFPACLASVSTRRDPHAWASALVTGLRTPWCQFPYVILKPVFHYELAGDNLVLSILPRGPLRRAVVARCNHCVTQSCIPSRRRAVCWRFPCAR